METFEWAFGKGITSVVEKKKTGLEKNSTVQGSELAHPSPPAEKFAFHESQNLKACLARSHPPHEVSSHQQELLPASVAAPLLASVVVQGAGRGGWGGTVTAAAGDCRAALRW